MCIPIERDSRKDEAVVFIFIFATAGLLGWALIRPWVEKWVEVRGSELLSCCHWDDKVILNGSGRKRKRGEHIFLSRPLLRDHEIICLMMHNVWIR